MSTERGLSEIPTDSCKNINSAWHISLQTLKQSVLAALLSSVSTYLLHGHQEMLLNFWYRRINSWIKEPNDLQKVLLNSRMCGVHMHLCAAVAAS